MRRLAEVPLEYLAAAILALGLGIGIYVLRHSTASIPVTPAALPAAHPVSHPSTSAAPPGNPFGVALIRRSEEAYARVPGVSLEASVGTVSLHFLMALRNSRVVAESSTGRRDGHTTELVRRGAGTFGRAPGSACWKRVSARAAQALTDLGHRFPYFDARAQILAPQHVAAGWAVNAQENGALEAFVLNAKTFLVRTAVELKSGRRVTIAVHALPQAPQLPLPEPRCG